MKHIDNNDINVSPYCDCRDGFETASQPSATKGAKNGFLCRDGFETRLYKNKYRIESARLKGWDYSSPGYYFITICTKNRICLFGEIENGKMIPNKYGEILENCWNDLPNHYPNLKLDQFVVMPNHLHGIIIIENDNNPIDNRNTVVPVVETGLKPVSTEKPVSTKTHGLFEFIRALKTFSARRINEQRQTPGISVWQTRFHDHIIRDGEELNRIRRYIMYNPSNWEKDGNYSTEVTP